MKKITVIIISFLLSQVHCLASYGEEYVLVSNKDCPVGQLTSQEVKRIFLGKMTKWPDGSSIYVVINKNKDVYTQFTVDALDKSPTQFSNYWRKVLFSGKSMLPVFVKNDDEVKSYIGTHENTLSYIRVDNLDNTLKKIIITK